MTNFKWSRFVGSCSDSHRFHALVQKPTAREMSPVYPSTSSIAIRLSCPFLSIMSGPYNFLLDTGTQITMVDPLSGR